MDTFPSTTADSERGFSCMNRVLTKERVRLSVRLASALMQIELCTSARNFDPKTFTKPLMDQFSRRLSSDRSVKSKPDILKDVFHHTSK